MEIFPFEDLFMEIFPLEYGFGDFFFENGDFSFRRFVRGDFSLKIYFGDFSIEFLKIFKKICSWRFFLWNMVLEIFPFEDLFMKIFPWRFILRDFSIEVLEIFIENLFIGDFFYDHKVKKMKIYSWGTNDWWFFFFFLKKKPRLWMRITLARSWCGLLDKSLLSSCKKIISISNEFFHWNELEVLT